MKNMKMAAFIIVLLSMGQVFAESEALHPKAISEVQVKQAISLLIKAGVISDDEAKMVLERPSMLEELDEQGYVDSAHAVASSICAKDR